MSFARSEILNLYRSFLKYGKEIKLTDRDYFKKRIRKEFKSNRGVTNIQEIQFHVEASLLNLPYVYKQIIKL